MLADDGHHCIGELLLVVSVLFHILGACVDESGGQAVRVFEGDVIAAVEVEAYWNGGPSWNREGVSCGSCCGWKIDQF